MATTLTEVAQAAGVSLATASRAFKDPDRLAAPTRERVQRAAADLGYTASSAGQRRMTFAVVVPDAANPVFASLIASMQSQAWSGRHRMMLVNTFEHPEREEEVLQSLRTEVDGVILASPRLAAERIESAIGHLPLVALNAELDFCPSVLLSADTGMRQAFEHLHALGHRSLTFVPGPASAWSTRRRQSLATELAREWDVELTVVGNQAASVNGGLAAAASVASSGSTAVLAYNDLVALGVQAGLRQLGRHCPSDLSIIGIDDLDIAAVAEPGLTSVRVSIPGGGALALNLLTDLVSGKHVPAEPLLQDSQLIVRGTTDSPGARR